MIKISFAHVPPQTIVFLFLFFYFHSVILAFLVCFFPGLSFLWFYLSKSITVQMKAKQLTLLSDVWL